MADREITLLTYEESERHLSKGICDACRVLVAFPAGGCRVGAFSRVGVEHMLCGPCAASFANGSIDPLLLSTFLQAVAIRTDGRARAFREINDMAREIDRRMAGAGPTLADESGPQPGVDDPWIHRSAGMRCRSCMFFVRKDSPNEPGPNGPVGRCRRHAPTISGYPVVFPADWCGDHKLDETKA